MNQENVKRFVEGTLNHNLSLREAIFDEIGEEGIAGSAEAWDLTVEEYEQGWSDIIEHYTGIKEKRNGSTN